MNEQAVARLCSLAWRGRLLQAAAEPSLRRCAADSVQQPALLQRALLAAWHGAHRSLRAVLELRQLCSVAAEHGQRMLLLLRRPLGLLRLHGAHQAGQPVPLLPQHLPGLQQLLHALPSPVAAVNHPPKPFALLLQPRVLLGQLLRLLAQPACGRQLEGQGSMRRAAQQ